MLLPRGGGEIPVTHNPESFTCVVRSPGEFEQLRSDPDVGVAQMLTRSVARATISPTEDVVALRDATMRRLREDGGLVLHHEYLRSDEPATAYRLTDEIVVRFGPRVSTGRIAARAE